MIFYINSFLYTFTKFMISFFNIFYLKYFFSLKNNLLELKINKKGKNIFILGSGTSINKISEIQWEKIKNHTSIGINYFILNKFVPDIIQLELQSLDDRHLDNLINIISIRQNEFKNSQILIKSNYLSLSSARKRLRFFKSIPRSLLPNLKFSIDFPVFGKNKVEFNKTLKMLKFLGILNLKSLLLIPHLRASIGFSCVLASRLNFNKIIFAGVDLNHTKYFFQKKIELFERQYKINKDYFMKNVFSKNKDKNHLTNDESLHEITIIVALILFLKNSKTKSQIYTFSDESALYPKFKKFLI